MKQINFSTEQSLEMNPKILDGIFKLRHETFIERLDWDIPSNNDRERDQFDDLDAHHISVVDDDDGEVVGCWRALPTTDKYMLKDVFPVLLQGEDAPQEEQVWEISRFAVKKGSAKKSRGHIGDVSIDLVRSFYDFAIEHNIKSYVTVTTVACERLLRQLGLTVRRLGEGKAVQIGIERSVALRIEVDSNLKITKQ